MLHLFLLLGRAVRIGTAALMTLGVGSAWAADAVLLASTVPGYVPGMVVATGDKLSLPDGATATLLFRSGEMLRLRGPFDGTLDRPQDRQTGTSAAALAEIFRMHGVDASVIGGTRATTLARDAPAMDDVVIDPQRSGTYCLQDATSVWIARPSAEHGAYAVRRKGSLRPIAWPPGAARVEWPSGMTIDDGDRYEVVADGAALATVTFRKMPAESTTTAAWVADGILRGCRDQFEDRLRHLSRAALPPELWLTSSHGRGAVFRPGEPVGLTVAATADGYLYCLSARADGTTRLLFPAGAVDGALVRASVPVSIPGNRQPAGLAAPQSGTEEIRCWLADRDVSAELADDRVDGIGALFTRIGARAATASLTIRVE